MHSLSVMIKSAVALLLAILVVADRLDAGDWPQWRGPRGDGVSADSNVPVRWGEHQSIVWKAKLPEWGASTPVIFGDSVFLTAHDEAGRSLLAIKLDRRTGEIQWTRKVGSGEANRKSAETKGAGNRSRQKFHELHNMASPSPITDGERVYFHFGNGDLAALDYEGNELWKRNLQDDHGIYTIWWGHANSPVLAGDLLISVCMQDSLEDLGMPPAPSYIVAHDKRTGEQKWKTMRMTRAKAEECDSYITPVLYQAADRQELLMIGGDQVDSYDPATGAQLWFLPGIAKSRIITGPTLGHGKLYATRGMRGPLLAVNIGGSGRRDADQIAWQYDKGTPDSCSPVLWENLLFIISDNGIAQCLDASTGELHWQERLPGDYKASPIAADGHVYFLNKNGLCTVVAAAAQFEKLAENKIDDDTTASLAVADGHVFLRGKRALYCIGTR